MSKIDRSTIKVILALCDIEQHELAECWATTRVT